MSTNVALALTPTESPRPNVTSEDKVPKTQFPNISEIGVVDILDISEAEAYFQASGTPNLYESEFE